jgi:hypothetical protein
MNWFSFGIISIKHLVYTGFEGTVSVVSWSEFLVTDPEARVRSPALPEKKE